MAFSIGTTGTSFLNSARQNNDTTTVNNNIDIGSYPVIFNNKTLTNLSILPIDLKNLSSTLTDTDEDFKNQLKESISEVVQDNISEDLDFIEQGITPDFLKNNLSSIMTNSSDSFRNIKFPNVLSHELIKVKNLIDFETNESSLHPSTIYRLKKDYIENIQNSNANSFYLHSENKEILREVYIEDLKENNQLLKKMYSDIDFILNQKDKLKIKYNFGNKISKFFLNDNQSSTFGKLANTIFNFNIAYNHKFTHQNNKISNNSIENLILGERNEVFGYFGEKLDKIFDLMISRPNSKDSFLKSIDTNKFLLNSDRVISQIILNTSVSLNGFYKDSISYEYWSKKILTNNNNNKILYDIIDSKDFDKVPLIKINSVLSIENNSNNIFNNLNNDEIYQKDDIVFNLSRFDKTFQTTSYLKKDLKNKISFINDKTFDVFNTSLFLENDLFNCGKFLLSTETTNNNYKNNSIIDILNNYEKTKKANPNEVTDSDKFFKNQYFNSFLFTNIDLAYYSELNLSDLKKFVLYESDIEFLKHDFYENKDLLENINITNNAQRILSSPKFSFTVYRDKNYNYNEKVLINQGGVESNSVSISKYNSKKMSFLNYHSANSYQFDRLNNTTKNRKFISDTNINLFTNIFRNYYEEDSRSLFNKKNHLTMFNDGNTQLEYNENLKDFVLNYIKGESTKTFQNNTDYESLIENEFKNHKNDLELTKGFVLFKNTMNELDINKIKDKFISLDDSLTKENEFLNDRVITYSQKNNKDNISYITDDLKLEGVKNNYWEKLAFNLRRNIFNLKNKKLSYLNENTFLDYLKSYKLKAKNVNKVLNNEPYVSLIYSNLFKNSLDTLENSDFIASQGEDKYTKFNFSKDYNNIKNSIETNIEINNPQSFQINSQNIKDFASKYFTNSQFQTSTSYFNFILWNLHYNVFNKSISNNWSGYYNGYDKLLSDAIIDSDNPDIGKCLVMSALLKHKNITVEDNFNRINNKTDGAFLSYIQDVYSTKNVKKQKSYTLRVIDFPDIKLTSHLYDHNSSDQQGRSANTEINPTNIAFPGNEVKETFSNGLPKRFKPFINNHCFDFGILPGSSCTFCFPFVTNKYDYNVTNDGGYCSAYDLEEEKGFYIVDKNNFSSIGSEQSVEGLYEYIYSNFYNYDAYLENSEVSLGQDFDNKTLYNFDKNEVSIFNILRNTKSESNGYFNKDTDFRYLIDNVTNTFGDINNNQEKTINDIENTLNYHRYGVSFKDYALGNLGEQPYFKEFINNNIIDMLKFLDNDFENKLDNIEDIEDALKFVNENSQDIKIIINLLKTSCHIYSSVFDLVVESSIRKNISKILKKDDDFNWSCFWDKEVYNLLSFDKLNNISNNKKYEFEKDIPTEFESDGVFFTNFYSQILNIQKVLNNSDIMEVMSIDSIMSYFTQFEKFSSETEPFVDIKNSLSNLEDLGILNLNQTIENDIRLNTVSKKMNDYFFYQDTEFQKVFQQINSDLNQNFEDHFDSLINKTNNIPGAFFSTLIKKEENKSSLALQGSRFLNILNLRYDIMRFGIDFDFANVLSKNKLLKFKIHISNHKYPNIFIPPIYKFYTPMLTDIAPSHLELLQRIPNDYDGIFIDDFVGAYDIDQNDIRNRYNILSFEEAIAFIRDNVLKNINIERLFRGEEDLINIESESVDKNSIKIVKDAIFSNAIKYTNYRSQKYIDENNIKTFLDNSDSSNNFVIGYFESMSQKDFVETFSESYEKAQNIIDNLNQNFRKIDIVNNESHFVEFFKEISQFINQEKVIENFVFNKYYDIFSIYIGRDDIKKSLKSYYSNNSDNGLERIIDVDGLYDSDFYDSFSYIIEAEIV